MRKIEGEDVVGRFNIRVYGLMVEGGRVLLTDEFRLGRRMTKFPGGGLQYGEGTRTCLERECLEELGQEVEVGRHFYTTDFFQPTLFLPAPMQMIAVYYFVRLREAPRFPVVKSPFDYGMEEEGAQCFRWVQLDELGNEDLTLPIDRKVVQLLLELGPEWPDVYKVR